MFRVKIDDFTSLQSCAILPSKMVFRIARPKYHVTRAADVSWVPEDQFSMAESKASKGQRGRYCVAGAPASEVVNRSFTPGICMYKFPEDPVVRGKWVRFVRRQRHEPGSTYTSLSAHFVL